MSDFRVGHLLEASPRAQFYAQLLGTTLSIFISATAYQLYLKAYTIPSPAFPAPSAYVWISLARLLRNGALPPHVSEFMLYFGITAIAVAALRVRATTAGRSWAKWIPSGVAFAVGFINTPNFSLGRLLGGLSELWYSYSRIRDGQRGVGIIIFASGLVLGEVSPRRPSWSSMIRR